MTTAKKFLNDRKQQDTSPQPTAWQIADIRLGFDEADREEFATPEEVVAAFAKFGVKYDL